MPSRSSPGVVAALAADAWEGCVRTDATQGEPRARGGRQRARGCGQDVGDAGVRVVSTTRAAAERNVVVVLPDSGLRDFMSGAWVCSTDDKPSNGPTLYRCWLRHPVDKGHPRPATDAC